MDIYVGNLPYEMNEEELQQTFAAYGEVSSVRIIKDRDTGRSKGFGFVEMPSATEAQAAIAALNGKPTKGRPLTVNEARGRPDGGHGGGMGGDMGGGGGRGGFDR